MAFNSGDNEIKQIAVASDGVIYASTFVGSGKGGPSSGPGSMTISISTPGDSGSAGDDSSKGGTASKEKDSSTSPVSASDDGDPALSSDGSMEGPSTGGKPGEGGPSKGAIYRIDTNGFHERYWGAPGAAVYSMILLGDGSLLVGTGDKGRIYSVSGRRRWKLLQKIGDGAQVSALVAGREEPEVYYAATSHPGKLYLLDFALAAEGTYTSKVFDAKQKSEWGKLHPDAEVPEGSKLEFSSRSGNTEKPEKTWSDWSDATAVSPEIGLTSPSARYLQYRARFKRGTSREHGTPELRRVVFYYQNENAAPVISSVKVRAGGFGVTKMPMPPMDGQPMNLGQLLDGGSSGGNAGMMGMQPPLKVTKGPGLCTIVWAASDPNQDKLTYSVAIRAEGEKAWTMLADKTEDTFLSFDSTGFREGLYYVKVTASDELSNTPETARTAEETSEGLPDRQHAAGADGQETPTGSRRTMGASWWRRWTAPASSVPRRIRLTGRKRWRYDQTI